MPLPPTWLRYVAQISLVLAAASALTVVIDLFWHKQRMWIMNVVWPLTALWSGPLGLYAYFKVGRLSSKETVQAAKAQNENPPGKEKPFWQMVGLGATHCGAGCSLGDIIAEFVTLGIPIVLFGDKVFGTWLLDFILAFLIGIAFQFFTIAPMRNLGVGKGIVAAVKADSASLTAWQIGMYGWMAIALFVLFSPEALPKTGPVFWFMMQIAMLAGFATSYPVNWWLIRSGLKEKM